MSKDRDELEGINPERQVKQAIRELDECLGQGYAAKNKDLLDIYVKLRFHGNGEKGNIYGGLMDKR